MGAGRGHSPHAVRVGVISVGAEWLRFTRGAAPHLGYIRSHLLERRPEDIFQRYLDRNVSIVPPRAFKGAKNTLNDQAQIDDCLETSVYGRDSRRRTQAAWMDYRSNKALMRSLGYGGR